MSVPIEQTSASGRLSASPHVVRICLVGFGLAALVVSLYASTFASMVAVWNRDSSFTHGYIIPILSLWLLWRDRHALAAQPITPAWRVLALVAALTLLWLCADFADIHVLRQAAATALIPCSIWVIFGDAWMRRAAFPFAYLMFAVPFGDFLVPSLVKFTTEFTVAAVQLVGVPIYREGTSFSLPSGSFEVVKACSGVRYLIATIALGTLFAAISYRSWQRRGLFMLISIIFPVIANGLRAFGIVMIAHYSQMKYAVGIDHLIYGWLFFGLVMWVLFWIGSKFADHDDVSTQGGSLITPRVSWSTNAFVMLAVMLAIAPALSFAWRATAENKLPDGMLTSADLSAKNWTGPSAVDIEWQPPLADENKAARVRYENSSGAVNVFTEAVMLGTEEATRLTGPLVEESQANWRSELTGLRAVDHDHEVDSANVLGQSGERIRVWRWYVIDGVQSARLSQTKWLQLRSWQRHRQPNVVVVVVAMSMNGATIIDSDTADKTLTAFVSASEWRLASYKDAAP